jgi:hypothetical protein
VVRRGTANPFSPVQIRVSPDQQKTRNLVFCSADITLQIIPIIPQQKPEETRSQKKRTVDTCLLLSIWSGGFLKDCKSLDLRVKERFE